MIYVVHKSEQTPYCEGHRFSVQQQEIIKNDYYPSQEGAVSGVCEISELISHFNCCYPGYTFYIEKYYLPAPFSFSTIRRRSEDGTMPSL